MWFELNEDLLQRHFSNKGVSHSCPFCPSRQWKLLGATHANIHLAPDGRDRAGTPERGLAVIAFICINCGHLRQHAASAFDGVLYGSHT